MKRMMAVGLNLIFLVTGISDSITLKHTNDSESDPLLKFCKSIFIHKIPDLYLLKKCAKYKNKMLTGAIVNES